MAVSLVARGLHQDIDTVSAWPLTKLFEFAGIAAHFEGRKFQ